ncbi:hypothetical protein P154DRAFT_595927 [Amniculicola lignicola CBS 123094]|uniref:Ankyrin n=1 Tax=Amniculicola lignicola CBS 123094 TaxID=1392246 RepID=A0A6A5WRT9_9PLEO|nr:hypothetical protein P154DRAFT_595927 [Amniculicola lignicola CBS 123094]
MLSLVHIHHPPGIAHISRPAARRRCQASRPGTVIFPSGYHGAVTSRLNHISGLAFSVDLRCLNSTSLSFLNRSPPGSGDRNIFPLPKHRKAHTENHSQHTGSYQRPILSLAHQKAPTNCCRSANHPSRPSVDSHNPQVQLSAMASISNHTIKRSQTIFPEEILEIIIQKGLNTRDLDAAYRAAGTSAQFWRITNDLLFVRMSITTKHKTHEGRQFLRKYLPHILYYRCKANNDRSRQDIIGTIWNIVDKFINALAWMPFLNTEQLAENYLVAVCHAIVELCPESYNLIENPSLYMLNKHALLDIDANALAVAIHLTSGPHITYLLGQGASPWSRIVVLDSAPLKIATKLGDPDLLASVLAAATTPHQRKGEIIRKCVDMAISSRDWATAATLISWFCNTPGLRYSQKNIEWWCAAQKVKHFEILRTLLEHSIRNSTSAAMEEKQDYVYEFFYNTPWIAVRDSEKFVIDIINLMIRYKICDTDSAVCCGLSEKKPVTLLVFAISTGKVGIVEAVLHMGANPDGILLPPEVANDLDRVPFCPLVKAVEVGRPAIVRLLLNSGANPLGTWNQAFSLSQDSLLHRASHLRNPVIYEMLFRISYSKPVASVCGHSPHTSFSRCANGLGDNTVEHWPSREPNHHCTYTQCRDTLTWTINCACSWP